MGNTPFELTGAGPASPHPAFGNILFESNRGILGTEAVIACAFCACTIRRAARHLSTKDMKSSAASPSPEPVNYFYGKSICISENDIGKWQAATSKVVGA